MLQRYSGCVRLEAVAGEPHHTLALGAVNFLPFAPVCGVVERLLQNAYVHIHGHYIYPIVFQCVEKLKKP